MSKFRARLFRPYSWRLWVQFALLGMVVILGPIFFISNMLLKSGQDVLIAHETIDLSDESNLRVNEFREDIYFLTRNARERIKAEFDKSNLDPDLDQLSRDLAIPTARSWDPPLSVQDARRRFLHGTNAGVYKFDWAPERIDILKSTVDPGTAEQRTAIERCLFDAGKNLKATPSSNRSSFHWIPPGGERARGWVALAVVDQHGGKMYAVVMDFTRYVWNRQQISPRHYYVVAEANGSILIHPHADVAGARPMLADKIPWKYPEFRERSWFDDSIEPSERKQRVATAVRDGGARLDAISVPDLAFHYAKCYFGDRRRLADQLSPERATAVARQLNEAMAIEIDADAELRIGEATANSNYIEVAHRAPEKLAAIRKLIAAWWKEHSGSEHSAVAWSRTVECSTMQGQLTPLRVDFADEADPAWLVVAASTEELREDIDDRFQAVFFKWVVPTLLVAGVLGLGLVLTLTHSLNRLARAAAELDNENPKPLPLGGPYEVSQLARTLDQLARDVQERDRELRERAVRYETILRAAGEGILITDATGRIEEANKAACRMFGYAAEELIGRPIGSLVDAPERLDAEPQVESTTASGIGRSLESLRGVRKDGSTFWIEVNQKPVPLRDRLVVTAIFRDVQLRREAEDGIRKLNDELDARVKQRTAELEEANGKLEVAFNRAEASSKAKDTFVANMSHELRQPLHIIIGFTEAMKDDAADLGAEGLLPDLNKVLAAAKHLLDLINDILDLAKIESGKLDLSLAPFPLPKLVADVQTLVGPLAEKNGNVFSVEVAPDIGTMTADERRVRQILINLLSNAFKFTSNGKVTLRVDRFEERGRQWVRFSVLDTGQGMLPDQVGRLFQRFYQADSSTTRGQSGTGLGLSITQSFCELMGGQPIRVTSTPGQGSEFTVTLPLVVTQAAPALSSKKPALSTAFAPANLPPVGGRVVLAIDDDPMVRELMDRFLAKEGFRVVLAATGPEGLELARSLQPSVITLDVMMPGFDGWTILTKLKEDPATADIPVVMLTIVDDRGRGFALGAADYLTKPIDWQRLGAILRKYLSPERNDRILVVDDHEGNRELIRRQLERDGYKVFEAVNGEDGLKALMETDPGLVLLDLMMPVMDGFGFLDELAKKPNAPRVPVIVLTAKELTSQDFDRLNGRVMKIIEKGDLTHLEALTEYIAQVARR